VEKAVKNTRNIVLSPDGIDVCRRTVRPFAVQWDPPPGHNCVHPKTVSSEISLGEAIEMAKRGEHAGAILKRAFPKTNLQLVLEQQKNESA
jgi:stage II sporulation protein D